MDTHARLIAFALQIALTGAVVLISLRLSPAAATALSPGYPVDAILLAMRSMLARTGQKLIACHKG